MTAPLTLIYSGHSVIKDYSNKRENFDICHEEYWLNMHISSFRHIRENTGSIFFNIFFTIYNLCSDLILDNSWK